MTDTPELISPFSPLGKARSTLTTIAEYAQWARGSQTLAEAVTRLALIAQMAGAQVKEIDGKGEFI